jgi:hypothetical protein
MAKASLCACVVESQLQSEGFGPDGTWMGWNNALTVLICLFSISMAWMCGGNSQESLISKLRKEGIIKTDRVASAMLAVDRGHYVKHAHESVCTSSRHSNLTSRHDCP